MDIHGGAITKPARIGFRPAGQEAQAIIAPERRTFVRNHTAEITFLRNLYYGPGRIRQ